jgi:hypothetical protein
LFWVVEKTTFNNQLPLRHFHSLGSLGWAEATMSKRKIEKTSTPNKRARGSNGADHNGTPNDGASHPDAEEDEDADKVEHTYRKGAICRVKMTNFMTYVQVEVCPGPALNLVVGFNGTGKSSIVAAIGLGLAGKTSSMGRADKPEDFIKRGCDRAEIELELHNGHGEGRNATITRMIRLTGESDWKIDNKKVSMKKVQDLTASLKIQVDNLCVFLAQEKVASFAKTTPEEFLKITETACEQRLLDLHNSLINFRKNERELNKTYDEEKKVHARMQQRQR